MVPYVRLVLLLCAVVVALQPAAAQKALQYNLEQCVPSQRTKPRTTLSHVAAQV